MANTYTSVRGTSTTSGTGTYATGTSFNGYLTNGASIAYQAIDRVTGAWETGRGTWSTGGNLTRTQIVMTSAGTSSAVSWPAGTRDIIINVGVLAGTSGNPTDAATVDELNAEAVARTTGDENNSSAISAHTSRTDNPHGTTPAQIGAYTAGQTDAADIIAIAAANAYTEEAFSQVVNEAVTAALNAVTPGSGGGGSETSFNNSILSWFASLPTTLPTTSGVFYNNNGLIVYSGGVPQSSASTFHSDITAWFDTLTTSLPLTNATLWNDGNTLAYSGAGTAPSTTLDTFPNRVSAWFSGLPTTLPTENGVFWNNGNSLAYTGGPNSSSDSFSISMAAWFNSLPTSLPIGNGTFWNNGNTLARS